MNVQRLRNKKYSYAFFFVLHIFSKKTNKKRLFSLSSLFRKKYTKFTSLCKSENISKNGDFSKILLTRSFPQVKFSLSTQKSLDLPWKTILLHSYHKVFPNPWGNSEKSETNFVGYTNCTKDVVEKPRAGRLFLNFVWLYRFNVI